MMPTERLVIVAQGGKDDIEDALVHFGKALGFQVVVVDPVPALEEKPDVLVENDGTDLASLAIGTRDYVVVLTKGERDVPILEGLSRTSARFVGLLASRHRLRGNIEELRRRGVSDSFVNSLHAPIGLNIGALTPPELALAILGDVIATKYGKDVPHKPLDE
jgi:xanthine dehydrogenase accessory factor